MSKNRIAKLLLALGIGAVTAATGVAAAGCAGKCNPDDGPGQEQPKTEYTVKYDLNYDGATGAPQNEVVEQGGKLTEPKGVTRQDYTLDGWYTEATGGTKWNFDTDTVTKSLTLYAHWTSNGGVQPGPGGEVTADGTLALLTADNFTAFGEGDSGENDVPDVEYEVKADKKLVLSVPADAGECYLVAIDAAAFTNEGQSDKTFDIKIGENTVTYSAANDWGVPPEDLSVDPVDFTSIKTIEVTATADVTIHIALAPKTIFEGGSEEPGDEYEDVTTAFDFGAAVTAYGTYQGDITIGKFTFGEGGRFENKSNAGNCWNSQGKDITMVLGGIENSVTFKCQRASGSGSTPLNIYKVVDGTETEITTGLHCVPNSGAEVDSWPDAQPNVDSTYTVSGLEAGTYVIKTNGKAGRINTLSVTEHLPKGNPTEISAQGGIVDYLLGDDLITAGMTFYLDYDNGRKDIINPTSVNSDALKNATAAGEYQIAMTYVLNDNTYNGTFTVKAYEPAEIELVTTNLNEKTPTVYLKGDNFDSTNVTVNIKGKIDTDEHLFYNVAAKHYTMTIPGKLETEGVRTLTVTAAKNSQLTDSFTYYVIPQLPATTKVVTVNVDPANSTPSQTDGIKVAGIQQAIDYLNAMNLAEPVKKVINVAAGTYNEKVYVNIPNLTIKGAGGNALNKADGASLYTPNLTTKITFNAIISNSDPAGMVWGSDNSATVIIDKAATNCVLEDLYLENYWNTAEKADEHEGSQDQALALLVQADKFTMKNCALSSYQDTIQLQTGRQVVEKCYIEGVTDFIYGTNNTTYFYGCVIHAKTHRSATDGGYITAFKGVKSYDKDTKKGDNVEYGAIFDKCEFTAEEAEIEKANWALARPWDIYSNVTVMNSVLGGHISKTGYSADAAVHDKNLRYVDGLKVDPTLDTVKFYEYNNTGAGALVNGTDAEVAGMHYLEATDAAKYRLYEDENGTISSTAQIFLSTSNTNVGYTDNWLCTPVENVLVTVTFKGEEETREVKLVYYKGVSLEEADLVADITAMGILKAGETLHFYTTEACETGYTFPANLNGDLQVYVKVTVSELVTDTYTYSYNDIPTKTTDNTVLTQADFTGVNAFITVVSGANVTYRTGNKCIENRDGGLQVTFKGTGTLTITFSSTGGSNVSHLGVKNAKGEYVSGTGSELVNDGADKGCFTVTGTGNVTVTFTIEVAGTYTIDCPSGVTNRGARIKGIEMKDTHPVEA